jgi:hypothetical protein
VVTGPKNRTGQHWYQQFFPPVFWCSISSDHHRKDLTWIYKHFKKYFQNVQKNCPKKRLCKKCGKLLAKTLCLLKFWNFFNIGNLIQNIALTNFKVEILWKFGTKKLMVPLPVFITCYDIYESSWNLTFVLTGPVLIFLWWLSNLLIWLLSGLGCGAHSMQAKGCSDTINC